tara:strand:- start:548 stop:706 length:159 start_codon:yes stop_codon:yes gene_type:complete
MERELEQLRKAWGLEKLVSPFISSHELDKFWEMRKKIEKLELELKLKNNKLK